MLMDYNGKYTSSHTWYLYHPYVLHYGNVTMGAMASQIIGISIAYSTVGSEADEGNKGNINST